MNPAQALKFLSECRTSRRSPTVPREEWEAVTDIAMQMTQKVIDVGHKNDELVFLAENAGDFMRAVCDKLNIQGSGHVPTMVFKEIERLKKDAARNFAERVAPVVNEGPPAPGSYPAAETETDTEDDCFDHDAHNTTDGVNFDEEAGCD